MRWTTALKGNAGLTLVEVLVAMAIVFVIFLGITNAGLVVLDQNVKNWQRDEAVAVADNVIQLVRRTDLTSIASIPSPSFVNRQVRGMDQRYTVTITDNVIDINNHSVTVNVAWNRIEYGRSKQYNHSVMTIVRNR